MKNTSGPALPLSMYPLTIVKTNAVSSAPDSLRLLKTNYKSFVQKPVLSQSLYQVHQMVKEEGNWDEGWFNSYE